MIGTAEVLRAAREKITPAENWTTESYAKTADGDPTNVGSSLATCWCALGAIMSVSSDFAARCDAEDALEEAMKTIAPEVDCIASFNDDCGHAAVLKAFDLAISKSGVA